jgi:hypothetical protein
MMDKSLKRRAYVEGLKLKNSKHDEEVIYAKLEKQGIPAELAKEVAKNVIIERNRGENNELQDINTIAWIKIIVGVLASIIAYILTDRVFFSVSFIIGGIILAIYSRKNKA